MLYDNKTNEKLFLFCIIFSQKLLIYYFKVVVLVFIVIFVIAFTLR